MLNHILHIVGTGEIHDIIPPADYELTVEGCVGFNQLSDYLEIHHPETVQGEDPLFWAQLYTEDLKTLGFIEICNDDLLDDTYFIKSRRKLI